MCVKGGRRCEVSLRSKQKINALKRAKYLEEKEKENERISNHGGEGSLPESSRVEGSLREGEGTSGTGMVGRKNPNGTRSTARLKVGGVEREVLGVYKPPVERKKELAKLGINSPQLVELDPEQDAGYFRETIGELKSSKWHASVYIYSEDEYKQMRLFLTQDGTAGIALKPDGDIVSVFAKSGSPHKSVANPMIATAVSLGGTKLDCFDTVLPGIYRQEGFVETERMKWDDQYKPDGWDYETYKGFNNGRPDVVMMEYKP